MTRTLDSGIVAAVEPDANGIHAFMGLPYAAPPMGALRWRPPQPVASWSGVRTADKPGPNPPQRMLFPDIDAATGGMSEDCLYVNVWTPAAAGSSEKLPVLFYIHGGGFAVGFGAEKRYNGTRLAERGLVVVTMNYRLNALGLLAHPALTAETGSSGNFAKLDLVAALQWVKRNISAFGGDPDCVTIAGESAGSMFVSMLMVSPLAKGLFHRAIGESGAQFPSPERPMPSLAVAEQQGLAFAAKLGAETADDLRAAPVEAILDANPGLGFWPIVDGHFLAERPAAIFAKGQQADVPLLAGWNKDEGINFNVLNWPAAKRGYRPLVKALFGAQAKHVLAHYPAGQHRQRSARELGGDLVINHSTWGWLEAQRATGTAEVFRYRFDRAPATTWFPKEKRHGAFHSCDIPYVFDNLDVFDWAVTADDQRVATLIADVVAQFAKTGNPNGPGLPHWPSYRDAARPVLAIDVEPKVMAEPDRPRHELLARILG